MSASNARAGRCAKNSAPPPTNGSTCRINATPSGSSGASCDNTRVLPPTHFTIGEGSVTLVFWTARDGPESRRACDVSTEATLIEASIAAKKVVQRRGRERPRSVQAISLWACATMSKLGKNPLIFVLLTVVIDTIG